MIDWLKRLFGISKPVPVEQLYLRIDAAEDKHGIWRWQAFDESGYTHAIQPLRGRGRGYPTQEAALEAARRVARAEWLI